MFRGEPRTELALACRLAAEASQKTALYVAALLHAIGKTHGRDADRRGADLARTIAERLGLSVMDVEHVEFLVREHMSLYRFATQRDTHDPETLHDVARLVKTQARLGDLYLLTVAVLDNQSERDDAVEVGLLEELYRNVAALLEGDSRFQEDVGGAAAIRIAALRDVESVSAPRSNRSSAVPESLLPRPSARRDSPARAPRVRSATERRERSTRAWPR